MFFVNLDFLDVCLTPIVVPVPIPYPNITLQPTTILTQFKTLLMAMPAHTLTPSRIPSGGDNSRD